jgi:Icc-related predicted phosphoesterase
VPAGDILIHAGDALCDGTEPELVDFLSWLGRLSHKVKIYVPGNHDGPFFWDLDSAMAMVPAGITVLIGSGMTVDGYLEVWGAPWVAGPTPNVQGDHDAFALTEGSRTAAWDRAPAAIDILVSHSPPVVAAGTDGDNLVDLTIWRASPRLVVCGHVHWARGIYPAETHLGHQSIVVNAACMGAEFEVLRTIIIDI